MSNSFYGTLFIVSTPIGNLSEASPRVIDTLKSVDIIACEDTRNTLKLLTHFDIHTPMVAYHNFNEDDESLKLIEELKKGKNIALVSDAGYPLISDPGYTLVNRLSEEDIKITVVSGPSASINALVASGLDTMHYLFYGFLSSKQSKAKMELEGLKGFPYTIIFYEAPHRINKTLSLMFEVLGDRKICVARELTKLHEEFLRGKISELKDHEYRGELVIVVEGCKCEEREIDIEEIYSEIDADIKDGMKVKEAVKKVCDLYSLKKNEVYNGYLKSRKI
ncbi:MAG: 16S rRNA (cytidine(1402)-2'-O)-methyltransferase [Erysipelotrichaceae bacterium]